MGPRNPFRLVVAVILLLLGTVWFLQGIGVLPGSFMTGSAFWAFAGAACVAAGILVLFRPGRPHHDDED